MENAFDILYRGYDMKLNLTEFHEIYLPSMLRGRIKPFNRVHFKYVRLYTIAMKWLDLFIYSRSVLPVIFHLIQKEILTVISAIK